jgi:hypothetical protein
MRGTGRLGFALLLVVLPAATTHAQDSEVPVARLGRPIPIAPEGSGSGNNVTTCAFDSPNSSNTARYQDAGAPVVPPPGGGGLPASPAEQYNCGVVTQPPATGHPFWDKTKQLFSFGKEGGYEGGSRLFMSDHEFDRFISPVTNPFLFEDPRSLTELRPIFMYQATPSHHSPHVPGEPYHVGDVYSGGDIDYLGLQARLALTERWSIVISEFGLVWSEPHNGVGAPDFHPGTGLAELRIGPKYTFLRNESCGTIGAVGLNFDVPWGDHRVHQDTGSLTLEPYVSFAQKFGASSFGTFHGMATAGYNAAMDNKRSDNLFISLHLDYDVGNLNKVFPFIETHWFYYTVNGKAQNLDFEGTDLFNFGSQHVSGRNEFDLAFGARYKFTECLQLGLGAQVPVTTHRHVLDEYRITFDVIFRY